MKLLIHICCGPCFISIFNKLKDNKDLDLHGFWFNPNIHPYTEYHKRKMTLLDFTQKNDIPMIWKDEYNMEDFLRKSTYRENNRCYQCYYDRLNYAAIVAKKGKFDYFTTTLLYSKFQNHQMIIDIGESVAKEHGVKFYYEDFRELWSAGIEQSKEEGMYRQQYCGCIYSEKSRYENQLKREFDSHLKK